MTDAKISEAPLLILFGSKAAYRVLMYLENYEKGYASRIAKTFDMSLNQVQKQLAKVRFYPDTADGLVKNISF